MSDTLTPAEVTSCKNTPASALTADFVKLGATKAAQPYYVSFFKAWMAGWMLVFGAMLVQIIQAGSGTLRTNYPALISLVSAFFFPIGLIMLVLTGQELVTAHLMFMPMALVRRRIKVWELPLNWLIVFFGNLAGVLCYVAFMAHFSDLYAAEPLIKYSQGVSVSKTTETWGACVLRGIGCNFLVCTAVWLGAGARETSSKIMALHLPAFLFVFLGFEHVVVNMYYIPIGMVNGSGVTAAQYIGKSMIPSLIGNIIGGGLLGLPMLMFYDAPELPLFNKLPGRRAPTASVVERTSGEITPVRTSSDEKLPKSP